MSDLFEKKNQLKTYMDSPWIWRVEFGNNKDFEIISDITCSVKILNWIINNFEESTDILEVSCVWRYQDRKENKHKPYLPRLGHCFWLKESDLNRDKYGDDNDA